MNAIQQERLVIQILTEAFQNNPSVLASIHPTKVNALQALAKYAYRTGKIRNGVYISQDQTGIAICYQYHFQKERLADYWNQLMLVKNVIGLSRIWSIMRREAYIKKHRPTNHEFLYFWFFGVSNLGRGRGAAHEIKERIFKESREKNLPIYLETSVEKNKSVYERYGFEVYHIWNERPEMTLWFMRRNQ